MVSATGLYTFAVSTHSRLKAAGFLTAFLIFWPKKVSTHSRLKAAGQPKPV